MEVLRLAAATPDALLARLDTDPRGRLGAGPARIAVADPTPERVALARRVVAGGRPWRGRRELWFAPRCEPGPVAFLFPGLEADFAPNVADVAAWLGRPAPDTDTSTLGRHGAAVIGVGMLLDGALRRLGVTPVAVAGHSVGEWTAMITGGLFSPTDFAAMLAGADLDALRVPGVEFAVLGCSVERAAEVIAPLPDVVVSHENSANQTVVCGPSGPVADVVALLRARGVLCRVMPFRSGFHTPMLAPYLDQFREHGVPSLPLYPPGVPVWSATTARPFPDDPAQARALCVRHLLEPVRFRQLVTALRATGIRSFVQMGSGQLASLVSDTLRGADHLTIAANSDRGPGMDQLRRTAAALWVEGAEPDFSEFDRAGVDRIVVGRAAVDSSAIDRAGVDQAVAAGSAVPDRLAAAAEHHPALTELPALLHEIEAAVEAVLAAAAPRPAALAVSVDAMPWLVDHCLIRQRPGWRDLADLRPVVPATTILAHLAGAAARPGMVAAGVDNLRLHRWLVAAPPVEVPIETRAHGDRVFVRLGDYAEGTVVLATGHEPAPAPWPPADGERTPAITAERLYFERWMFHGPGFRGITATTGVGPRSATAEITVPAAPGALLDNVGQVIGLWLAEEHPHRPIAFPSGIGGVRFHAPEPRPGDVLTCALRITSVDERRVVADAQVSAGGRVLVSVTGWVDARFDSDERTSAVHRFPETSTLSARDPAGWWLAVDRWTPASREYYSRKYLAAAERAEFDRCPPRDRRDWLLGRIAAKDAVRGELWERGYGPLFPAELRVSDGADGLLVVAGVDGLSLPPLAVAVAVAGGVAVALAADAAQRPGVAVVAVGARGREAAREAAAGLLGGPCGTEVVPAGGPDRTEHAVAWTRARQSHRETA